MERSESGMKKSDLVSGEHVLEVKNGEKYFVCGDYLHCNIYGWMQLSDYQEDLTFEDDDDYTVIKIYKIKGYCGFQSLMREENLELVWERKKLPKLTVSEKNILNFVSGKYKWIARDKSKTDKELGSLYIYKSKPYFDNGREFYASSLDYDSLCPFKHMFQDITFENSPIKISDLLQ